MDQNDAGPTIARDDIGIVAQSLAAVIDAHAARLARERERQASAARPSLERIESEARVLRHVALDHMADRVMAGIVRRWRRLRTRFEPVPEAHSGA